MEVNGGKGLVSLVVQSYVEERVDRHMVVVIDSPLEVVVAMRVDQIPVAPPIFDCSNLDACSHCNFFFLQHNCNQTHSQRGESS